LPALHGLLEEAISLNPVRSVEDSSDVSGYLLTESLLRDVGLGVLLQVKLAALPGDIGEDSLPSSSHPRMVIANDQADSMKAPSREALQEVPPVDLSLGERDASAQDGALALRVDPNGTQQCLIDHPAPVTHLLVARINVDVGAFAQWARSPALQFLVKLLGEP